MFPGKFSYHRHSLLSLRFHRQVEWPEGENVRDQAGLIISSGSTTHWSDRPPRGNLWETPLKTTQEASSSQPLPQMALGHLGSRK